ncbi:zf-MYND multi-domain protein [Pyrenophora tritici-repentis]|uniref:MYND finger n=2 Tax=Pyrenophora tritici-repentis TaxID=45151 RepID=A0A922NCB8_9PLEO|nr:zf-MYND multi-domain protein [Pyrenophora tritici-repentis]KAI0604963.1 zf-MYND multi-domain protein [Pyrenophora tritici-repentis]KAI0618193.1 zf-MYND multi-domain protein [Pyrenophora tritici-repentis]KAI1512715.1 MYND finger [Pyrenophora tritici-repentis]KAI1528083.1 MYND domain protein [Pyrenophora tritici-repentis]
MPPRSVCLNVFTTSLGDSNLAVNNNGRGNPMMERRDSAQSDTRRSSDGSVSSQPTHPSILPPPAFNRPELFHSLRPMASTESLNVSLTSKPCTSCSGAPARRRCSRCKAAYYCDRNCQKSDWKTHRNVCEPITQTYSAPATPNFSNPASPTTEN